MVRPHVRQNRHVRITAKVDYAVRAMVVLASRRSQAPVAADTIAKDQQIPLAFLIKILVDLRTAGLVISRRGASGGHLLARDPAAVSIADVIRAAEGPLADVRGTPPEDISYPGASAPLRDVWLATRVALREVLEETTIADVVNGSLPPHVTSALARPGADRRR
jgi:Rrf2 family protein